MERIEKEHYRIEIYHAHLSCEGVLLLGFPVVGLCILIAAWIIAPHGEGPFLFLLGGLIFIVIVVQRIWKRIEIILARDAFIQMELKKAVPWEDIDCIEVVHRTFFTNVFIYYRKDGQIKKLRTFYPLIEDKKQFLESLKRIASIHGISFKEYRAQLPLPVNGKL